MCRIALCEDTEIDRLRIEEYMRQIFDELERPYRLTCFESAEAFFDAAAPHMFDLVVFDVELGSMNGIAASRLLRANDKSVIIAFTSSHPEYVFSSFNAEPLNYLLKPVRYKDLFELVDQSLRRIDEAKSQVLTFETKGTLYSVAVKQVVYLESNARIVRLVTDQSEYSLYGKLDEVARDEVLAHFIRCHKSYLVNPAFIREIAGSSVTLSTGTVLPISRSNIKRVKQEFVDYLGGATL